MCHILIFVNLIKFFFTFFRHFFGIFLKISCLNFFSRELVVLPPRPSSFTEIQAPPAFKGLIQEPFKRFALNFE